MNPSLKLLATELATDPEGRGYATMTPEQVATELNAPITVERSSLSGSEIYNAMVPSEFTALTAENKQFVRDIFSLGTVDVSTGTNARDVLVSIFTGTQTLNNLAALVNTTTTRSQQIGYSEITEQMVLRVREAQ